ncbi:MAG: OmpA family protein [Deltaproteobacteria bacterium]|nr:OmpA family protein [Deltaproteobacteria bacterium]
MGRLSLAAAAWILFAAVIAGCAPGNRVILVPDPDGKVGKAEVVTESGSRLLEKPNDMTVVSGKTTAPSPVATADPAYIASTFREALSAEPLPPEKFILFFEPNGTALVRESQGVIDSILEAARRRHAVHIGISGHTDAVGSAAANDALSRERAEAVRALLAGKGLDPASMTVASHGKGNPLIPTPDGIPEPRNRRVEVVVR